MIDGVITWSVKNRLLVAIGAVMLAVAGIWALRTTPVDAIPDLSDVQVIVYTEFPDQGPQVVEDQITYPLSTAMLAVPGAEVVRGYSFYGYSLVYIIFDDGTDLYWARSRVLEYLSVVGGRLPDGATPQLGPDATGVGWVYQYALSDFSPRAEVLRGKLDADRSGEVAPDELPIPEEMVGAAGAEVAVFSEEQLRGLFLVADPPGGKKTDIFVLESMQYLIDCFERDGDGRISRDELLAAANFRGVDLSELRSLQDWLLRYDLMSLPGVSEVASVGGFVKQYQVEVDPEKLRAFGIGLDRVRMAIRDANIDVDGRMVEMAEHEYMVRGKGYITSIDDLETVPIAVDPATHTPVLLKQVARVVLGPDARRGLVDLDGEGEVVGGIVLMRYGENALDVIGRVQKRLDELKGTLPPGVEVHVTYDRSGLILRAIDALRGKLVEEMVVVALVCLVFLLHLRSAFVGVMVLPLGVLASFLLMRLFGINANIMSLGGIAIAVGVMVDASVVLVENLHKHRERDPDADQETLVIAASREVGPALFFSLAVITVSFLPVFALENQEGRLFAPLAWTKTFAMGASAVLSVTVIPALMVWLVRGHVISEAKNPLSRVAIWLYRPVIAGVLRHPWVTLAGAALIGLVTLYPASQLGSEFMPPLNEGDLLYMPTTPPGISVTKARELLQQTDRIIATHPQVKQVFGKIGRAETATDPAPLMMIETTILLEDEQTWPEGKTIEDISRELDQMVQIPGLTNAWTMPIKTRIDMLATGIKTPVGIKLLGDDLEQLSELGQQIEAVVRTIPGTASVYAERVTGGNFIDIRIRREDAARYGLNVSDVQDVIRSAIGGMNVTWTVEGLERYPVNVRYPRELRDSLDALGAVAVPTPMGHYVPLSHVADIEVTKGPMGIKSEDARRTAWIYVDLSTSDIGGYVQKAAKIVHDQVPLPPGVTIKWSGQYEYMARAAERLAVVVPLTLGVIFLLLFLHFRRLGETVLVMVTVPFALVGGVWLLYFADYNLSVAVVVGAIALAGLAAETGVVMLVYLEEAIARYEAEGRLNGVGELADAIAEGAVERVRPKLMTVATTIIGLLPIMWGTEAGVRVMKRIAAPMVGGLVSSTVLTLVIVPAAYLIWRSLWLRRGARPG